jgi:hypothetical protein
MAVRILHIDEVLVARGAPFLLLGGIFMLRTVGEP